MIKAVEFKQMNKRRVAVSTSQGYRTHEKAFRKLYLLQIKYQPSPWLQHIALYWVIHISGGIAFTLNALFLYTLELFGGRESRASVEGNLKNVLSLCRRC